MAVTTTHGKPGKGKSCYADLQKALAAYEADPQCPVCDSFDIVVGGCVNKKSYFYYSCENCGRQSADLATPREAMFDFISVE